MEKKLYYIECTCIREVKFPNTEFNIGDVLYYNKKGTSNEMYCFNRFINPDSEIVKNANKYYVIGTSSYLPFTRKKQNAKKWEIKSYAEHTARIINELGEFNAVIKEIKVTYEEEYS